MNGETGERERLDRLARYFEGKVAFAERGGERVEGIEARTAIGPSRATDVPR